MRPCILLLLLLIAGCIHDARPLHRLTDASAPPNAGWPWVAAAWSGDSVLVAGAHHEGAIRVWHAPTGRLLAETTGYAPFSQPQTPAPLAFSPDNAILAFPTHDNAVRLWNPTTNDTTLLASHSRPVREILFSPNGRLLTASGGVVVHKPPASRPANFKHITYDPITVITYDLATYAEIARTTATDFISVTFSPAGDSFVGLHFTDHSATSPQAQVELRRTDSSAVLHALPGVEASFRLRFSPDGRLLLTGFHVWDTGTWKPTREVDAYALTFVDHGRRILSARHGRGWLFDPLGERPWVRLTYLDPRRNVSHNAGRWRDLPLPFTPVESPRLSPDGRFFVDGRMHLFAVPR